MATTGFFQIDHSLDDYIDLLKKEGVEVSQHLHPAVFALKNGLPYAGLLTDTPLQGLSPLVTVPLRLLLTSHKALKEPMLS
ncbi:unnamed protein product [Sphagnum balticum]